MDENGTLDLSMKKTKRDGGPQASEPPSSSSSVSQPAGAASSQGHPQPEWEEEPLDFTAQSGVKEEEHEEVEAPRPSPQRSSDRSPETGGVHVSHAAILRWS